MSARRDQQRVSVGIALGGHRGPDGAGRARLVLDDDRLPQALGHLLPDIPPPMVPAAPGLFSTMIGCRKPLDISCPIRRATRSTPPPGGKPTMSLIGCDGKSCAAAGRPTSAIAIATSNPN